MTRVDFYHGAPDKLATACRLIGELYRERRKVIVYAPEAAVAAQVDRMLWTQPAIGFVPHTAADGPLAAETPVLIAGRLDSAPHDDVLVNLSGETPAGYASFEQLVEIVSLDEPDRTAARARFKFYRDRGYPLQAHDLGAAAQ